MPLRVAAISFLNPAPLLYSFEHEPDAASYRERYAVHYTTPARCAAELHNKEADLGLIPVAQLSADLAVVPGCTIASLAEVRSILLLVRCGRDQSEAEALRSIRTLAADRASRSSTAYVRTLLRRFYRNDPTIVEADAAPIAMLAGHDAALVIGDPALLAREDPAALLASVELQPGEHLLWLDLAALWRQHTALPWVAAVWALRPEALPLAKVSAATLIRDTAASRDQGLAHTEDLVREWTPRLPLRPETIHAYLTRNIYYRLDEPCLAAIRRFRDLAHETGVLPALPDLNLLRAGDAGAAERVL